MEERTLTWGDLFTILFLICLALVFFAYMGFAVWLLFAH